MSDLLSQFAADAAALPSDAALSRVVALVLQQEDAERRVKQCELELAEAQKQLAQVQETDLPDALAACGGVTEIKIDGGLTVKVEPEYYANIPTADKPESTARRELALRWLREAGHGSLIKNEVKCAFGRGEDDKAQSVMLQLIALGFDPTQSEAVHHSTLKSFVKEQMENGTLPEDAQKYLGVHVKRVAKIKHAKKR